MSQRVLIVASNDVGFTDINRLRELGLHASEAEAGYSGGLTRKLHDENITVRPVPLESVISAIKERTALLNRVDGVCLMSCRPYGRGEELTRAAQAVRGLAESLQSFPAIPVRTVPLILSDIKQTLAGRATERVTGDWIAEVGTNPAGPRDLSAALRDSTGLAFELAFQAMRAWSLDLMLDLEVSGLIIARAPGGVLVPRVALRRKAHGGRMHTPEFDPQEAYRSGLPIFAVDLDIDREPFLALNDLLNDDLYRGYARGDRTKAEIMLHRFLDQNLGVLHRDRFEAFLSEASFAIRNGTRRSIRPDLILRPVRAVLDKHVIVELKLPSAPVFTSSRADKLSRSVLKAIQQVRTYRGLLLDPAHHEQVGASMGEGVPIPADYELAVLIGLRSEDEPPDALDKLRVKHNVLDVKIIRYNELVDGQMKLAGKESPLLRPW